MRNDYHSGRLQLVLLAITLILLFVSLTWTPAYGYGIARIDNIASQTDDPSDGGTDGAALRTGASGTGVTHDRYNWSDTKLLVYDLGDYAEPDNPPDNPPETPEPATVVLVGLGLAWTVAYRKAKR
jgi:hypothetical protein